MFRFIHDYHDLYDEREQMKNWRKWRIHSSRCSATSIFVNKLCIFILFYIIECKRVFSIIFSRLWKKFIKTRMSFRVFCLCRQGWGTLLCSVVFYAIVSHVHWMSFVRILFVFRIYTFKRDSSFEVLCFYIITWEKEVWIKYTINMI